MNASPSRIERAIAAYKPEYCERLKMHCGSGYTFGSFAAKIDIAAGLVDLWLELFEEFAESQYSAESRCKAYWEDLLLGGSATHSRRSEVNVPLIKWVLASRWPDEWKPKPKAAQDKLKAEVETLRMANAETEMKAAARAEAKAKTDEINRNMQEQMKQINSRRMEREMKWQEQYEQEMEAAAQRSAVSAVLQEQPRGKVDQDSNKLLSQPVLHQSATIHTGHLLKPLNHSDKYHRR